MNEIQLALEKFCSHALLIPQKPQFDYTVLLYEKYISFSADKIIYYIFKHNKNCKDIKDLPKLNVNEIEGIRINWTIVSRAHTLLVGSLIKIIEEKHLTFEQVIMSYIQEVYHWSKIYDINTTFILVRIFRDALEELLYDTFQRIEFSLYELALFTIFETYKDINCNQDNRTQFIRMMNQVFGLSKRHRVNSDDFQKYVNLVGIEYYNKFIDEIYNYMKNYKETVDDILGNKTKDLLRIIITHYFEVKLISKEYIEELLKIFAENGTYNIRGLLILRDINSSYVDTYESFLLMEDLKK